MSLDNKNIKVIMSGGGTGGHIFPALAIANEIKKRKPEAEILFVGAKGRMEMEKVPAAGYPIKALWISGINRTKMWKNLALPFKLISSLFTSWRILSSYKPDFVVGTGGFASGAVLYVAQKMGIPTFIQEQNSYPGITNKLLQKNARKIFTAYDGLEKFFSKDKIVKTGNPIRKAIYESQVDKAEALQKFGLSADKKTLLSIGGSLGANPLNQAVKNILPEIEKAGYQVIWQTGKNAFEAYKQYQNDTVKVVPFIAKMQDAYASADVIISRAGAGTISELCLVGKPVILVPSPYVAEDHQSKNAKALSDNNAAVYINEKNLNDELWKNIDELFVDSEKYNKISSNIKKMALPEATAEIVDNIFKTLESKSK